MHEYSHVIDVLKKAKKAALEEDVSELKLLSNKTIHSSTIYKDTDNILVAIVVYSLGKLIERKDSYDKKEFDKFLKYYSDTIDFSVKCIENDKCELFRNRVEELANMKGLSKELKESVKDVFRKAKINKASKIYEHGLSMEATAKLLGISLWELAEYNGQRNISDNKLNKTRSVEDRVKIAMEIFDESNNF